MWRGRERVVWIICIEHGFFCLHKQLILTSLLSWGPSRRRFGLFDLIAIRLSWVGPSVFRFLEVVIGQLGARTPSLEVELAGTGWREVNIRIPFAKSYSTVHKIFYVLKINVSLPDSHRVQMDKKYTNPYSLPTFGYFSTESVYLIVVSSWFIPLLYIV